MPKINSVLMNVVLYLLGSVFIALGVVLMLKSHLGVPTWDTLHYSIHVLFNITLGTAVFLVAFITTIIVVIMRKKKVYLFMMIPVVIVSVLVDVLNLVIFENLVVNTWQNQVLLFVSGILLLPLGGATLIITKYPAGVFDELMLVIMDIQNTSNLIKTRVIIELSAVIVALILGIIAGINFGMINIGTLISGISVGYLVKLYLRIFERMNIYEY
ncbi:MAG: hypothetical protein K9L74_00075 [Candidatus Izimaplasma sp.]|nr:hypothetical protein [Candidatus Izimaplasma bacterium]